MTERESPFSLASLREVAERADPDGIWQPNLPREVLLALVDAAGAALSAGAMVAGARCYRRPDSKLDPDPGPCGKCAACIARDAFYDSDGYPAAWWTRAIQR